MPVNYRIHFQRLMFSSLRCLLWPNRWRNSNIPRRTAKMSRQQPAHMPWLPVRWLRTVGIPIEQHARNRKRNRSFPPHRHARQTEQPFPSFTAVSLSYGQPIVTFSDCKMRRREYRPLELDIFIVPSANSRPRTITSGSSKIFSSVRYTYHLKIKPTTIVSRHDAAFKQLGDITNKSGADQHLRPNTSHAFMPCYSAVILRQQE